MICNNLMTMTLFKVLLKSLIRSKCPPKIVNEVFDDSVKISTGFVNILVLLLSVSVLLLIPFIMAEGEGPIEQISNTVDRESRILMIIWAFTREVGVSPRDYRTQIRV